MVNKLTSLIAGPTDRTKIFRYGSIKPEDYQSYLDNLSNVLIKYVERINIIPDDGISLDFAKSFKRAGGIVVGYVPSGHLGQFSKNYQFCTSIEEFDSGWSGLNTCLSFRGDIVIALGLSPGTIVELAYTKYSKIYRGRKMPVFLDMRTIKNKIPSEVSEELNLRYFSNNEELQSLLNKLKEDN